MSRRISKSAYIRGLLCAKSLFLDKNHKELKQISEGTNALFATGHQVGDLARNLFPGGTIIPYIPEKDGQDEQVRLTREAIESGATVIYEAAFLHNDAFVKVDILVKNSTIGNAWTIYEVKSGTTPDPLYLEDIAFQHYVVTGAGIPLASANLVFINNQYVRQGELDLQQLFTREDVTQYSREREPFVIEEIANLKQMLAGEMPECSIGKRCTSPYECDFKTHCWSHIPEDSVFDLRGNGIDKDALYNQGIIRQADIPADILAAMNEKQRQQVESTINQVNSLNKSAVRSFLATLAYPLYLLDFETFINAIPQYNGQKPYQQTPFQYSLHIVYGAQNDLQHREFLAQPNIDPRRSFVESLAEDIPANACVVTFNKSFECSVLRELARLYPEYEALVTSWIDGMVDLMVPFRQRDVYFWAMKGSYSIKYVLPALCPELSYEGLSVANGGEAMSAYFTMCEAANDPGELWLIRKSLLEYCFLDTFGMLRIIEALKNLIES